MGGRGTELPEFSLLGEHAEIATIQTMTTASSRIPRTPPWSPLRLLFTALSPRMSSIRPPKYSLVGSPSRCGRFPTQWRATLREPSPCVVATIPGVATKNGGCTQHRAKSPCRTLASQPICSRGDSIETLSVLAISLRCRTCPVAMSPIRVTAMRILMLHNRYKIPGGEDVSTRMQVELLRSAGHTVELIEESNERVDTLGGARTAARTFWSGEAFRQVNGLLEQHHFNVMHVQNFFPLLSPSVYYAAKRHRLPVLQSLRNFRLLCPEGMLHRDDRLCTDCVGRRLAWPGIRHACYRDSRLGTSVVAAMSMTHQVAGTWRNRVALYVTPSRFAAEIYEQAGWDRQLITTIPNFVHPDPGLGSGSGGYALYVGRLAPAKGIATMLAAWRQYDVTYPLRIAGDGPLRSIVESAAAEHPSITYLGPLAPDDASTIMGEATFVIVPTVGVETFGRVAAEALAKGTPALVSDLGGLTEIVDDGRTGRLVRPGDPSHLARQVSWMIDHPARVKNMRRDARSAFLERFSSGPALHNWLSAYQRVVDSAPIR